MAEHFTLAVLDSRGLLVAVRCCAGRCGMLWVAGGVNSEKWGKPEMRDLVYGLILVSGSISI